MYGYIVPDKPNLYMKDYVLYRAFYCGVCKATAKGKYGQLARLTANYDITFLSVFLHSYLGQTATFSNKSCILNPLKRKPTVDRNGLLDKIIALNILMSYHNLTDDIIDGEGLKKFAARFMIKRAYRKAKKRFPAADKIIACRYKALRELETAQSPAIDRVADCFACMLRDCVRELTGGKTSLAAEDFTYQLGRYIYLIDAVDDADSDTKEGKYNPLVAAFGASADRQAFFSEHKFELDLLINGAINRMIDDYRDMNLTEARNLLDNIIIDGLSRKYKQIIASPKKLKAERI
jgi:hypothetical protein